MWSESQAPDPNPGHPTAEPPGTPAWHWQGAPSAQPQPPSLTHPQEPSTTGKEGAGDPKHGRVPGTLCFCSVPSGCRPAPHPSHLQRKPARKAEVSSSQDCGKHAGGGGGVVVGRAVPRCDRAMADHTEDRGQARRGCVPPKGRAGDCHQLENLPLRPPALLQRK